MTEFLQKPSVHVELIDNLLAVRRFDFKAELRKFIERSNSPETRRSYASNLKEFFSFTRLKMPQELTDEDVINWRDWLKKNGNKDSTIKTKLACVRSFLEYLKNKNFIPYNPANRDLVPPPKTPDILSGRALEPKQIKILLSIPKVDEIGGARDYALMLLMLRTFMRVSEAVSLRDTDIFSRNGGWFVRIKFKGGETKTAPIPKEVKQAIDRYLFLDREHRALVKTREGEGRHVFLPSMGKKRDYSANKPITTRHAWYLVGRYGELLFMPEILKMKRENPGMSEKAIRKMFRLTPHDFRRTAVTRSLDLGESYRRVQNAARMKSITTVQRYDHHRQSLEENSIHTLNYDEE
jgi:site-specific recombinase XerD